MKRFKSPGAVLLGLAVLCLGVSGGAAAAERYTIDPTHSFVGFRIAHLGFSVMQGRFNDVSGEFTYDSESPAGSSIHVEVATASLDTNNAKRDKHIRNPDFLDVEKYPKAVFQGRGIEEQGEKVTVTGDLTLHGVTRPVTIEGRFIGAGKDPWGGYRRGYTGSMTLKRADFGMGYNLGPAAEEMELVLTVEGIRQ